MTNKEWAILCQEACHELSVKASNLRDLIDLYRADESHVSAERVRLHAIEAQVASAKYAQTARMAMLLM